MKYRINKENLGSIVFNEETNELSIHWNTGGQENAVCGFVLEVVKLKEKIISTYKSPRIDYDENYNNPF
jgi:hypothetical protein